jgi:hypothetical protein
MRWLITSVLLGGSLLLFGSGCERAPDGMTSQRGHAVASAPASTAPMTIHDATTPVMVVSKNPSCGCCVAWVDAMRSAGFEVEVHDVDNLDTIKTQAGIPAGKGSCHTAQVGGYFIEGHVPAGDIRRLLAEHPRAKGLVLPGMPVGAPGMEGPGGSGQPYTVELVGMDGSTASFAQHEPDEQPK